jgi:hypothetical protein
MSLPPPWPFRFAHNNDAGSGSYISDQNAKDLIRIDENLVRQEISPERRAELVAKKVQLEGIVRKGNFSGRKPISGREKLVAESVTNVVTGQGVKSPAAQLFEQLGYAKSTGQSRFKEWAFQTGYEGPPSSLPEGELATEVIGKDGKKRIEGKSERQIAEEVGCSKSKVNKVINSTGQKRPVDLPTEVIGKDGKKRKARKTECEQKIVELAQAGLGATAISKQTGLSRSTVRARLGKIALDTIQSEVDALPAHLPPTPPLPENIRTDFIGALP